MKKLVTVEPKKSVLIDVDMPVIKSENDVLVKLKYCGVCMSEHHDWSTSAGNYSAGHEPMGIVAAVGNAVKKVKVGDRVTGLFSGCAEYVIAHQINVFKIPDNVPDEAATVEPLACLLSAVSKVRIPVIGDRVAVVGCGYMGCGAISLLKMRGAYVVAVDINPLALENAKLYGADEVYTPDEVPATYKAVPGSDLGFSCGDLGFPLVMEWGETAESLQLALDMTAMCGQLALGAYHNSGMRLVDVKQLNVKAIDCLNTHPRERDLTRACCKRALELMSNGKWAYRNVKTKVFPISEFDRAHEELPEKTGKFLKAIVDWESFDGEPYII